MELAGVHHLVRDGAVLCVIAGRCPHLPHVHGLPDGGAVAVIGGAAELRQSPEDRPEKAFVAFQNTESRELFFDESELGFKSGHIEVCLSWHK